MMKNTVPLTLKYLFSSKLRVKVLSHFFFHPGEDFYIRHLASVLKEPPGTLARELSHLEKAGILKHEMIGKQKHYSLQKDSPIVYDLMNIFLKTSGAGAEIKAALGKIPGIELAFIYGSYASGEAAATSDIDLMIIGEATYREVAPIVSHIERRLNREINYTIYTRSEAEKRFGQKGDFVHEVLSGPRIMLIGKVDDRLLQAA
ncbi:MAG: nucleotidyltransferase domain-containing protein [Deltaproteobacteria bacterium]|nr:nucleotidyltransferase domain-containing protein [Deltaproteobacteria bacterium]